METAKKKRYSKLSTGRHAAQCSICKHPNKKEIDSEYKNWGSPVKLAKEYGLTRQAIFRHARATNLVEERKKNIRAALERLIERVDDCEVTSAAVVSAIQAFAKINAQGRWIDTVQGVNLNELFDKMSSEEMEAYAISGSLPDWFTSVVGITPALSEKEEDPDEE